MPKNIRLRRPIAHQRLSLSYSALVQVVWVAAWHLFLFIAMALRLFFGAFFLIGTAFASPFDNVKTYECGVCRSVLEYSQVPGEKFEVACYAHIGKTACGLLFSSATLNEVTSSEDFCLRHNLCPKNAEEKNYAVLATSAPNIRVSKAIGVKVLFLSLFFTGFSLPSFALPCRPLPTRTLPSPRLSSLDWITILSDSFTWSFNSDFLPLSFPLKLTCRATTRFACRSLATAASR